MAQLTYAEFKAKYQSGYGLATSTQLSDAYRQYQLKGTLPGTVGTTAETTTPTTTTPTETTTATPNSFAWWLETYHPGSHTNEELIALQSDYVDWYNAQAFPPGTTTPTVPTTPTTPEVPTVPPEVPPIEVPEVEIPGPPEAPTVEVPPAPVPPEMPEVPTIEMPKAPIPPIMPEAPTIEIPKAPTPPEMPEVPEVPPYERLPSQVALEEEYGEALKAWREAKGYGIPEETQAQMLQRATDILKARETESIRVMKNNMESRQITNSGYVFANEMTIKSNTTVAIANYITDVQINSALMKMASFEKSMGATAQFLGYLSEQSQLAYAPKFAQWGMEAQYGLVGYEVAAQYKMAGYNAEVAGVMAQAQIDAQYGLTAVDIAAKYGLTEYQSQVTVNMAQAQMAAQYGLTAVEIAARYGLTEYQAQAQINLSQTQIESQYGLAGYQAQIGGIMAQFQADQLALMAEWQTQMDLWKMEINQAYNQDNILLAAQIATDAAAQQHLYNIELAEMEIEASQQAAAAEGAGNLLGTASGAIATIIAK